MTLSIRTQWVTVPNQDLAIDAYFACPEGPGPFPAVIVVQEIFGVNAHIRDVTERLAREGYAAIAPALYQRLAPGFETGYTPEAVELGKRYKAQTQAEELLGDLQATMDFLYQLPQIQTQGVGLIGFCFGGLVAFIGASLASVIATASFYGAGIPHWSPGDGKPALEYVENFGGAVYAFFGLEDQSIPVEDVNLIEDRLRQANPRHRVFRYSGADHGFFCDQRDSYEPKAAADAWEHTLWLFKSHLKRP
ncbi:MAG: dienelactone hydrolase family protein [Cyanobacteriota bacterium]|jgi:carboxymethylenebutenolidase